MAMGRGLRLRASATPRRVGLTRSAFARTGARERRQPSGDRRVDRAPMTSGRQSRLKHWRQAQTPRLRDRRGPERRFTMTKVVAIMSMSLDGYVADANDGV